MEHNPSSYVVILCFIPFQSNMGSDSAEKKSDSIQSRCGKERTSSRCILVISLLHFTAGDRRHVELTCGKREPIPVKTSQITLKCEHVKNSLKCPHQQNGLDWKGISLRHFPLNTLTHSRDKLKEIATPIQQSHYAASIILLPHSLSWIAYLTAY